MNSMLTVFMTTFARTVRIERIRQNVTQEELAEMADISPQFLCRLENARKTASIETYIKIGVALHLRLADIFCEDKLNNPSDDDAVFHLLNGCTDFEKRVCAKTIEGVLAGLRDE